MSRTDKADWKIVWIFCGMLAVCSLLMMRIYLLSMSSGLQQAAAEQSSYTLTVTTTRGRIYDRRMQPLTDTEQHDLIAVLPTAQAAQDCAKQIEGTARRAALDRIAQGTPFLLDITGKDGEREKVYSQDVENITTAARLPHDPTEQRAVHLLGYRDSEGKGLTGIERAFDSRLEKAGEPVRVRCQVDALGRALEQGRMQLEGNAHPPKDGVVLTLDSRMQQIVEQVGSQIDRGAVVVMEVDSGELIACASFPSYDPYRLESALKDERKPLINRALMPYCVGSSFKLAVAAASSRGFLRAFRSIVWVERRWQGASSIATITPDIGRPICAGQSSSPATPILSGWDRRQAHRRCWGWRRHWDLDRKRSLPRASPPDRALCPRWRSFPARTSLPIFPLGRAS